MRERLSRTAVQAAAATALAAVLATAGPARVLADDYEVSSDTKVTGFKFPESAAYDPNAGVLYVGEFVSELAPAQKDGAGRIDKVGQDGKIIEEGFLPAPGQTMDKPKGIWVAGNRLWTTDIDSVWVFDLETREGKKLPLPGAQFANDPAILGDALYVSDNRGDQLFKVEPADFLHSDAKVEVVYSGGSINPNGIYPAADGSLLMVGFAGADAPRAIWSLAPGGEPKKLSEDLGRLDGVYQLEDGDLLVSNWDIGSIGVWSADDGMRILADGFEGPADFTVIPKDDALLIVAPDLVQGELRLIEMKE